MCNDYRRTLPMRTVREQWSQTRIPFPKELAPMESIRIAAAVIPASAGSVPAFDLQAGSPPVASIRSGSPEQGPEGFAGAASLRFRVNQKELSYRPCFLVHHAG